MSKQQDKTQEMTAQEMTAQEMTAQETTAQEVTGHEMSQSAYDVRKLGRDDVSTPVMALDDQAAGDESADVLTSRFSSTAARYHSVLAMEAARKMRRTKLKKKTGQEVCHHLKMMLSTEPVRNTDSPAEGQFKLAI